MAKKASNELLQRIKKNSKIEDSETVSESRFFKDQDFITTPIPMLNVALSGDLNGGFVTGVNMFAGPSKHFKTLFGLILTKAYMDKYEDSACLFYDDEFGTGNLNGKSYFDALGFDKDRILHSPLINIEQLKFDLVSQLDGINRGDKLKIFIDSVGNLASKKEIEDALKESDKADMTRAKQLKSLFRMILPYLNVKDIPLTCINHTYKEISMFPKDIVGGGTGSYYGSNNIFIIGRQQEKDKKEGFKGFNFILNVEKSRFVKEKSKIPIKVLFDSGISRWSGLLENGLESGHVVKPKNGSYQKHDGKKAFTEEGTDSREFWEPILADEGFQEFIRNKYQLTDAPLLSDEEEIPDGEE